MCLGNKKLVILGIPWDVDSEELRQYMSQFGELVDAMVMKDRASGRSRGFGYVTFSSSEDAEKALAIQHSFKGRMLEVKVATPKASPAFSSQEDMVPPPKKSTRIFVARIPPSVTDEDFHSYFMKYGPVIDAYMPKEPVSKLHRGIGFVTYENADCVDKLMSETHELGGSTIAVDRATPKEESRAYRVSSNFVKKPRSYTMPLSSGFSNVDNYASTVGFEPQANKLLPSMIMEDNISVNGHATLAAPTRVEKKLFVGRVPVEATSEDIHAYFSQFGWVLDVYLPKDAKKASHRGFGFVTFADDASAARVSRLRHYLFGREIAVESASPTDRIPGGGQITPNAVLASGGERGLPSVVPHAATENFNPATSSTTSTGKWGKKIFIGRIPIEATAIDLRLHFSQFGHIVDVYLPKDETKRSHRGFGFVTFADEISAEYASQKIHKILGQKIVLDQAAPLENEGSNVAPSSSFSVTPLDGSIETLQNLSSQQAYDAKVIQSRGATVNQPLRTVSRYRPY